MEMVAATEVNGVGEDITPPLRPLAYALHHSFLFSHCSSCFSPLPPNPFTSLYCSLSCSSSHSLLHFSSASHHLHLLLSNNPPAIPFHGETSDLRLALLLLLQIKHHQPLQQYDRICGLMSNRHKLLMSTDDDEFSTRIKTGARVMAAAIMMRDGAAFDFELSEECLLEEAVLCVVVTNAVEVQDSVGRSVGVAIYDISFSWINHSCSPNACYRFLPPESHGGGRRFLISPASSDGSEPIDLSANSELLRGSAESCGGPRLVVRSMKPIKKGEQVTIAYTDLLQPKELRQLDLWSKYRFTCCCCRCVAVPLASVDQCLQEISASNGRLLSHDVGVESFTEYIDDAIDDYISSNNAESCCKKLENALLNGFQYERLIIRLHPQHHLSLNCYTTLASAYKVRAMDENRLYALKMNRFSAAYSLLLAVLTHHLFLSESSLIKSVSYFWIGAGEAVLNLARSLVSNSGSDFPSCKCSRCGLIDMFEANIDHGHCPNKVLDISMDFLNCISDITRKVWKFLVHGNGYLEEVKDPVEFRWWETIKFVGNNGFNLEGIMEGQERDELFGLSGHCLLYGGILSNISGGHDSHLSRYVRRLVYDGDGK
ncbi:protein SET DOMAIN GROUP 41 [Cynara cardunculus var. scolymus]|uniref:protein SET DOMAIN GROUP 41 n=1 Tax=Cynara cardunculus var. scolymus TaxID=59895 RepID=UPI000D62BDD2|nr:protein SET DOMAIN GROUP 41 [Cynara cardunculus var. scolymus]